MSQDFSKVTPAGVRKDNVYRHPEAHPLVLDLAMLQVYGPDWLTWESDTVELRVSEDNGYEISAISMSKLEAMRTLHMVDSFWERWEVFVWCAMPMNGIFPDFDVMQVPTVFQCMTALHTARRVRTDVMWSEEIKVYLAAVHRHDEVLVPQDPLNFVRLDLEDFPIDVGKVKELWPKVKETGAVPKEETPEAEQLARMLELYKDFQESRLELREQLKVVLHA